MICGISHEGKLEILKDLQVASVFVENLIEACERRRKCEFMNQFCGRSCNVSQNVISLGSLQLNALNVILVSIIFIGGWNSSDKANKNYFKLNDEPMTQNWNLNQISPVNFWRIYQFKGSPLSAQFYDRVLL